MVLFILERDNMKNKNVKLIKLTLSALFLALAYVMPFLTGQIPEVGAMLCPLHIPVLLCGFICGWQWGLVVGFAAPLLRSSILGMPPFFPAAVCMAFELAAYGALSGMFHRLLPRKKPFIYCSLVLSMLIGRLVWGVAMFVCTGIKGGSFTLSAFVAGAFVNAVPGIILQIIFVPLIVMLFDSLKIASLRE